MSLTELRLFGLGEIFYRVQLAVAFGYADASGVHVGVEDVGAGVALVGTGRGAVTEFSLVVEDSSNPRSMRSRTS